MMHITTHVATGFTSSCTSQSSSAPWTSRATRKPNGLQAEIMEIMCNEVQASWVTTTTEAVRTEDRGAYKGTSPLLPGCMRAADALGGARNRAESDHGALLQNKQAEQSAHKYQLEPIGRSHTERHKHARNAPNLHVSTCACNVIRGLTCGLTYASAKSCIERFAG